MMILKFVVFNILLISVWLMASVCASAQNNNADVIQKKQDSIKMTYLEQAALRYPAIRQISLSNEIITRGVVKANLYGNEYLKGKALIFRNRFNFNIPVVQWNKNSVSASIGSLYQYSDVNRIQSYNNQVPFDNVYFDRTTQTISLSYNRLDSLLGVPVLYYLGVSGLINTSKDATYFQSRFTYTGLISFQVKHTANTSFSIGAIVAMDPSSTIPILPRISYYHRFSLSKMELFVDMPSRIALRKEFSPKSSLSFNNEIGSSLSFFNLKNNMMPYDAVYSSLELKTGFLYEYRVSKKMVLGVSSGLFSTFSSKMIKRDESQSNYFMKSESSPVPYVNVSLSFLPFMHSLKL